MKRVGIDETSAKRGQDYISLFFDLRRLLFGAEGKDHETVRAFAADVKAHKGDPANVTDACIDMSKAFIKGVNEALPNAEITFDPFHRIQHMNDALSKVRSEEARLYPEMMKGSRYAFLKNPESLTEKQDETLTRLCNYRLKTARAYLLKLALQDVYFAQTRAEAEVRLKGWYNWAIRSKWGDVILRRYRIKDDGGWLSPDNMVYSPFQTNSKTQIIGVVTGIWRKVKF